MLIAAQIETAVRKLTLCVALAAGFLASNAQASIIYEFTETSSGVVGILSGSLDISGLTPSLVNESAGVAPQIIPSEGVIVSGGSASQELFNGYALDQSDTFGTGFITFTVESTGSNFAINTATAVSVFLPTTYVSGTPLEGTMTFAGASFSTLSIVPGVYNYDVTGSSETVTLSFEAAVVPLPAGVFTLLGALGLGAVIGRRRRPAQVDVNS